jgi:acyl carrier protein
MVPSVFMPLETLPLNSSGKVDRRALPPHEHSTQVSHSTTAPSTPTESTLIDIWKDLLQLKQVDIRDNFFELGGHSLLATQMTSRVRNVLGLELPLKHVFEAPTITQLARILDTLRDTPSSSTMPPLVRLERSAYRRTRSQLPPNPPSHQHGSTAEPARAQPSLPSASATDRSPLIPLTLGSHHEPPFFCVHPMFGVVFPYLELAHHLGSDRSFYGLQPLGLDGKTTPLNRIEAIATYYINAIQAIQPHGPYFLGGWSFGGLVAFEMAQQLTQSGQEVALLAILDTPAPSHNLSPYQSLKFLLGHPTVSGGLYPSRGSTAAILEYRVLAETVVYVLLRHSIPGDRPSTSRRNPITALR